MAGVTPTRYRWGAIAWLLTLQFFVVETVVQLRTGGSYSRADDVISDLGTSASAAPLLMNASFVAQGVLIGVGAVLLRPALAGLGGRLVPAFLTAAAVGVVLVGLFPLGSQEDLHQAGAGLHFVGGGLGLLALAYAVRPRSEVLGTALALLGLLSTAMTVFFALGITSFLGEGGTERASAYPIPIGLALAGGALTVWGVEASEESVACALENAQLNGIANAAFFAGEVAAAVAELRDRAGDPDVVVVDPPRAGLTGKALRLVGGLEAERLVYVSCNPTTLAGNAKELTGEFGYRLERARPVDMFPHTPHVETVALFTRA